MGCNLGTGTRRKEKGREEEDQRGLLTGTSVMDQELEKNPATRNASRLHRQRGTLDEATARGQAQAEAEARALEATLHQGSDRSRVGTLDVGTARGKAQAEAEAEAIRACSRSSRAAHKKFERATHLPSSSSLAVTKKDDGPRAGDDAATTTSPLLDLDAPPQEVDVELSTTRRRYPGRE